MASCHPVFFAFIRIVLHQFFPLIPSLHSPNNISTGYGNIAPSTEGGKIFCILYAIFGIPLFGFLLAGVGDQLGTIFVKSILRVEKIFRVSSRFFIIRVCFCVLLSFRSYCCSKGVKERVKHKSFILLLLHF